ncbi:hypothetical protein DOU14_00170 [Clavibacter michiganensis subsp. michiganensis]|nr:hypothetical protein [Clavibacter michiganensis subsp. michiganensis]MWJ42185.1 hypothetical protein [Clavibacter michiganensis subsp. michiganensis]MWJ65946.1 hypothetical protein [Clavibacter michiganensis subsp. michiganensis]UQZ29386.1 hypothetical protein DQP62_02040 [Clavibacter michiganensis subsp. michiganensis]
MASAHATGICGSTFRRWKYSAVVIEPEDHRADRSRALASSSIVVAFFLFSQLVIVPLFDGRSPATQAVPASVVAVLMFGVTYLVSVSFQKRRRRRSRD